MLLTKLLEGITWEGEAPECEIVGLTADSRQLEPGWVYVCQKGQRFDGHDFAAKALELGAAAVVVDRDLGLPRQIRVEDTHAAYPLLCANFFGRPADSMKMIGVTGTNGKTTSAYLLEHLFTATGHKVGVLGTVSYRWPGHCEAAPLTTPDPLRVHAMLAAMAQAGVDIAVMEVSSHALEQQRVCGVPFAGASFSNLTQDHLDFHQDMESYFRAKSRLFLELPRADKVMAINGDDPWGRRLLELCPRALSFGLQKALPQQRHLWGELLSAGTDGCHLRMHLDGQQWELRSPLVGAFNASNLLSVQALALELGLMPDDLRHLEDFHGVCGRLERVPNARKLHVFVDYAHTPDALVNVLKALRGAGFKRIVTVFGCGGNRDRTKRPIMGEAVARYSDVAVLTSDNPRFEDPEAILKDVLPGLREAREVVVEVDRRKATAKAVEMLGPDDALLIAGKGHEDYQIIQGTKHHYSDQEVVRELLGCA